MPKVSAPVTPFRSTLFVAVALALVWPAIPAGLAFAAPVLVAEPVPQSYPQLASMDPYQAILTKVVHKVEWQRQATRFWQKAMLENLLLVGDTLRTGSEAKAELLYGDGSVTRVGSLTSLTLTGDKRREIHLDAGKLWLHIRKGGAGMRIITPGAVAAVTGTELLVEVDPLMKTTEVTVFEGAVNVTGDVGSLVKVLGGTTTRVPFRAPATVPLPLDQRKLQERDTMYRTLSAPAIPDAKQPDAKQPDVKQPDVKQPDAKQPDAKQPDVKQPDVKQPDAKQPDAKQPDAKQPGVAADPVEPTDRDPVTVKTGTADVEETKPVTPDLKGQAERLLDPRVINGSPTTGRVRVIIE